MLAWITRMFLFLTAHSTAAGLMLQASLQSMSQAARPVSWRMAGLVRAAWTRLRTGPTQALSSMHQAPGGPEIRLLQGMIIAPYSTHLSGRIIALILVIGLIPMARTYRISLWFRVT
jgi:hypothetical protein